MCSYPMVLGLALGWRLVISAQAGSRAQVPEVQELVAFLFQDMEHDPAALAGWKKGTRVVPFGLKSTLRLTLDRAKNQAVAIDPAEVVLKSGPLTVAEFGELRALLGKSRSTDPTTAFRDPIPWLLEAARKQELLKLGSWQLARRERILRLFEAYAKGGASSGISTAHTREFQLAVEVTKQETISRRVAYRDSLDDLKVVLKLPFSTPIVIDDSLLGGFRSVFVQLAQWESRNGEFDELDGIVAKLPTIPDITIGDRMVVKAAEVDEGFETIVALASGRVSNPTLAQSIRKRLRRFVTVSRSYQIETKKLGLFVQRCSTEMDLLIAPSRSLEAGKAPEITKHTKSLNDAYDQVFASQERLIAWWIEAQTLRFELTRDLGLIPATWDEFVKESIGSPLRSTEPQTKK